MSYLILSPKSQADTVKNVYVENWSLECHRKKNGNYEIARSLTLPGIRVKVLNKELLSILVFQIVVRGLENFSLKWIWCKIIGSSENTPARLQLGAREYRWAPSWNRFYDEFLDIFSKLKRKDKFWCWFGWVGWGWQSFGIRPEFGKQSASVASRSLRKLGGVNWAQVLWTDRNDKNVLNSDNNDKNRRKIRLWKMGKILPKVGGVTPPYTPYGDATGQLKACRNSQSQAWTLQYYGYYNDVL